MSQGSGYSHLVPYDPRVGGQLSAAQALQDQLTTPTNLSPSPAAIAAATRDGRGLLVPLGGRFPFAMTPKFITQLCIFLESKLRSHTDGLYVHLAYQTSTGEVEQVFGRLQLRGPGHLHWQHCSQDYTQVLDQGFKWPVPGTTYVDFGSNDPRLSQSLIDFLSPLQSLADELRSLADQSAANVTASSAILSGVQSLGSAVLTTVDGVNSTLTGVQQLGTGVMQVGESALATLSGVQQINNGVIQVGDTALATLSNAQQAIHDARQVSSSLQTTAQQTQQTLSDITSLHSATAQLTSDMSRMIRKHEQDKDEYSKGLQAIQAAVTEFKALRQSLANAPAPDSSDDEDPDELAHLRARFHAQHQEAQEALDAREKELEDRQRLLATMHKRIQDQERELLFLRCKNATVSSASQSVAPPLFSVGAQASQPLLSRASQSLPTPMTHFGSQAALGPSLTSTGIQNSVFAQSTGVQTRGPLHANALTQATPQGYFQATQTGPSLSGLGQARDHSSPFGLQTGSHWDPVPQRGPPLAARFPGYPQQQLPVLPQPMISQPMIQQPTMPQPMLPQPTIQQHMYQPVPATVRSLTPALEHDARGDRDDPGTVTDSESNTSCLSALERGITKARTIDHDYRFGEPFGAFLIEEVQLESRWREYLAIPKGGHAYSELVAIALRRIRLTMETVRIANSEGASGRVVYANFVLLREALLDGHRLRLTLAGCGSDEYTAFDQAVHDARVNNRKKSAIYKTMVSATNDILIKMRAQRGRSSGGGQNPNTSRRSRSRSGSRSRKTGKGGKSRSPPTRQA